MLLGAQDCFWEDEGAYTGEISPRHLAELGVKIVELGHAERRKLFHENNADVAKKAAAVCRNGMIPLVCVGELSAPGAIASMAVGRAVSEIEPQVTSVLQVVPAEASVIFAYEPVWAIGAKEPAGVGHVGAVVTGIRRLIEGMVQSGGYYRSGEVRVVYGGSAGPGLWAGNEGLKQKGGLDGMFLGRFSHDTRKVEEIVNEVIDSM